MATSSSAAMMSSLVVVLLLSVVVASQAHQVSCTNTFEKAMAFNGVWTGVGMTTDLEVNGVVAVEMFDGKGVKLVGKFKCPEYVKALEFVHKEGFVKAQVTDFSGLGSTLDSERSSLRSNRARQVRGGGRLLSSLDELVAPLLTPLLSGIDPHVPVIDDVHTGTEADVTVGNEGDSEPVGHDHTGGMGSEGDSEFDVVPIAGLL